MNTEVVTPDRALEILEKESYARQRRIDQRTVDRYADEIVRGRFLSDTVLRFCRLDGSRYLVDGQHRLFAVAQSGKSIRFAIQEISCSTIDEVDNEYSYTDIGKARTVTDALGAWSIAEKTNLFKTQLNTLKASWLVIDGGFKGRSSKKSPQDIRDGVLEWAKYMTAFLEVIKDTVGYLENPLQRAGLVSVALVTLRYQEKRAKEFWGQVSHDDGLRRGDPAQALIRHLLSTSAAGGHTTGKRESTDALARGCGRAWNAFYDGDKLINLVTPSVLSIKGTPFE